MNVNLANEEDNINFLCDTSFHFFVKKYKIPPQIVGKIECPVCLNGFDMDSLVILLKCGSFSQMAEGMDNDFMDEQINPQDDSSFATSHDILRLNNHQLNDPHLYHKGCFYNMVTGPFKDDKCAICRRPIRIQRI